MPDKGGSDCKPVRAKRSGEFDLRWDIFPFDRRWKISSRLAWARLPFRTARNDAPMVVHLAWNLLRNDDP